MQPRADPESVRKIFWRNLKRRFRFSFSSLARDRKTDCTLLVLGVLYLYLGGHISAEAFHSKFWEAVTPYVWLICGLATWNVLVAGYLTWREPTLCPVTLFGRIYRDLKICALSVCALLVPALLSWGTAVLSEEKTSGGIPFVPARLSNDRIGYGFEIFDGPRAVRTQALGINNSGMVVGQYVLPGSNQANAFSAKGGAITTLNFPGALGTSANGLDDLGDIVGSFNRAGEGHGFLLRKGQFSEVNFPGASETSAIGITASGEIVGYYEDSKRNRHGFLETAGSFAVIDVPAAKLTNPMGINSSGQITGTYVDGSSLTHGFLMRKRSFWSDKKSFLGIDFPGAASTMVTGINDSADIVGYYQDRSDSSLHGFLVRAGRFVRIDVPGGKMTRCMGINKKGRIVGISDDSAGEHGFVATPE